MLDDIDPIWLKSFQCVYEQHSFKQAAEHLSIPTSNVSRHVALLEDKLGTKLLERTTRRVTPTCAGEQLYSSTKHLLSALHDALHEVSNHTRHITGQLKVLMPDIPPLAQAAVDFCCSYPDVQFLCDTSLHPREDFLDGFDLILTYNRGTLADSGWVAVELCRWSSVVVASPELIDRYGTPRCLSDLQHMPCITSLSALNGAPWVFQGDKQPVTFHPKSTFRVNSGHIAKAAAIRGLGLAIMPQAMCETELVTGQLQAVSLEYPANDLVLYAFYAGRKFLAPKISAFLQSVCSELASSQHHQ